MYKEYRGMSRVEAVGTCYQDMAARHRSRFGNIQIIRVSSREQSSEKELSELEIHLTDRLVSFFALNQVAEIAVADVRRQYIKQLLTPKLAFPLPHRLQRVQKANRSLYQAKRPSTFY
jgi:large subunit ribosomal protein L18Ae